MKNVENVGDVFWVTVYISSAQHNKRQIWAYEMCNTGCQLHIAKTLAVLQRHVQAIVKVFQLASYWQPDG